MGNELFTSEKELLSSKTRRFRNFQLNFPISIYFNPLKLHRFSNIFLLLQLHRRVEKQNVAENTKDKIY